MKDKIQKLIREITIKKKHEFNSIRIQIQNGRWETDKQKDDVDRSILNPKIRARDNNRCCFCNRDIF